MENKVERKQLPAFAVLFLIAVVAAVVLSATNMITRGPIARHQEEALRAALNTVLPAESYEAIEVPKGYSVSGLYAARNGEENAGWCVTASVSGYGGPVAVTLGVDADGVITGCVVGDTSFAETAGYGQRAREEAFQEQFKGIDVEEGGSFDAISGATVTSEAVRKAVNNALTCLAEVGMESTPANPVVSFRER